MYTRTTQIRPQKQIIYKHISKSKTKKREDQNKKREHITQGGFSSSSSVFPLNTPLPPHAHTTLVLPFFFVFSSSLFYFHYSLVSFFPKGGGSKPFKFLFHKQLFIYQVASVSTFKGFENFGGGPWPPFAPGCSMSKSCVTGGHYHVNLIGRN